MKRYDSFLIGHITNDESRDHLDHCERFYGGAELFSAYAAWAVGAKVGLLTKTARTDAPILDLMPFSRQDIYWKPSESSTSMLNWYHTADRERRDLIVSSVAESFRADEIPDDIQSEIYHLAGLIRGDYEDGMIETLSRRGKVAVDMQGFLRCLDAERKGLYFADYEEKYRVFPYIHFLKTDAAEAEILTGCADRAEAARQMHAWGAKEVMVTHNSEVLVCAEGTVYTCPMRPRSLVGRAGRGDTAFGVYLVERLHSSVQQALNFATAAVSLKLETAGPLKNTSEEILRFQRDVMGV